MPRKLKCPRCASDRIQDVSSVLTTAPIVGIDEATYANGRKETAPEYDGSSEVVWDSSETQFFECCECDYQNTNFLAFVADTPEHAAAVVAQKEVDNAS